MTLKLYADPGSGSCRRVSAMIKHLNIEVEDVFIDLLARKNREEEFLTLNPTGMVPFLVDDEPERDAIMLSEASAIMIYLCEKTGDTTLWPSGASRYDVLKWMFWAAEHFRQPAPIYFEEKVIAPVMGGTENIARLAEADRLLALHGPILDRHLQDRNFVVGDSVTLADFDLAAPLSQMPRSHIPYDTFPNIMRWATGLEDTIQAWRVSGQALNDRMDKALLPTPLQTKQGLK